jgi:hypothetical protein
MPKAKRGYSLEDLRAEFDPQVRIANKIRAGLKSIGDSAMNEEDFRVVCGLAFKHVAQQAPQFADHIIEVRQNGRFRRLWCGTTKFAAAARAKLGIK